MGKCSKRKKLAPLLVVQDFSVLAYLVLLFSSLSQLSSSVVAVQATSVVDDSSAQGLGTVTEFVLDKASQVRFRGQAGGGRDETCVSERAETCWREGNEISKVELVAGQETTSEAVVGEIGSSLVRDVKGLGLDQDETRKVSSFLYGERGRLNDGLLKYVKEFPEVVEDFEGKATWEHESSAAEQEKISRRNDLKWSTNEREQRFRDLHRGQFRQEESVGPVTTAEERKSSQHTPENRQVSLEGGMKQLTGRMIGNSGVFGAGHFVRLGRGEDPRRVLQEVFSPTSAPAAAPHSGGASSPSSAVLAVAVAVPVTAGITIAIAIVCFIIYRKVKQSERAASEDGSASGRGGGGKEKDDRPLLNTMWLSRWGDGKKGDSTVFSVDAIPSSKKSNPLYESQTHPKPLKAGMMMDESSGRKYGTAGFLKLAPEESLKKLRGSFSNDDFRDAIDHSISTRPEQSGFEFHDSIDHSVSTRREKSGFDAAQTTFAFSTPTQARMNIDVRVSIDSSVSQEMASSNYAPATSSLPPKKHSGDLSGFSPSFSFAPVSADHSAPPPYPSTTPAPPPPPPPPPGANKCPPALPPGGQKAPPPPPPPPPPPGGRAGSPPPPPPGGRTGPPPPPPPPPGARTGGPPSPSPPPPGARTPPPPPPPPGARTRGPPPPPPPPGARTGGPPPPPPPPGGKAGPPPPPMPPGKGPRPPPPPPGVGLSTLRLPTPAGALSLKPSSERVLGLGSGRRESLAIEEEEPADSKKLKPLHWEKVKPTRQQESVWNNLLNGSFELDTQQMEKLFQLVPAARPKSFLPSGAPKKEAPKTLIEPRKAHNISIQIRGLGLTTEEICEALLEGDESVSSEVLEKLSKMSLSDEETRKIQEYEGPRSELGPAEKFLQALLEVPNAFQRISTMLFRASFKDDLLQLEEAIAVLEMACKELKGSRTFVKLLEAVLKTGNRLNMGTFRGEAQAFKLETLLRLADIKGTDGKTSLLHFVIQEIIRAEGARVTKLAEESPNGTSPERSSPPRAGSSSPPSAAATPRSGIFGALYAKQEMGMKEPVGKQNTGSKHLGLTVVMGLNSDLSNVKRAAGLDTEALANSMAKLSNGLKTCRSSLRKYFKSTEGGPLSLGGSAETDNIELSNDVFNDSIMSFVTKAESDVTRVQKELSDVLESVKSVGIYFYGDLRKDDPPLRVFQVVKDFLIILDRACKEVAIQVQNTNRKPPVSIPFPPPPRG